MNVTHYAERQRLLDWGQRVLEVAQQRGDDYTCSCIHSAMSSLQDGRFMLAVMGKVKRGKSTLVNAMLGRTDDVLAPIGKMPATSVISRFMIGNEQATVHFRDGRNQTVGWNAIQSYVTESGNPENRKDVDCVDITGAFENLEKDLCLVDTPGAGSMHLHHDAVLHGVLPQADAVIFLVTARMPIASDELDLLRSLKAAQIGKVFFAINKVDASDDDEVEDGIAHNLEMLSSAGISVDSLYRISAKKALSGKWSASGIDTLLDDIGAYIRHNRVKAQLESFQRRVFSAAQPLFDDLGAEISSIEKTEAELRHEIAELRARQEEVTALCKIAKRRFLHDWDRALDSLSIDLTDAEDRVHDQVQARIATTSSVGVKSLVKQAPTLLVTTIETEVQPLWGRCESLLKEAAANLENEMPDLTLPRPGRTFVNATGQPGAISKGIGKGLLIAGTGFGIQGIATGVSGAIAGALSTVPVVGTAVGGTIAGIATIMAAPTCILLVGIGSVGVVTSYRTARIKIKDDLTRACERQVRDVFVRLRTDRLNALRSLGERLWEDHEIAVEMRFSSRSAALASAISDNAANHLEISRRQHGQLQLLLEG